MDVGDADNEAPIELLTFEVGEGRYALFADIVHEVVRAATLAPLPKSPSIIEGIINFRGKIVPVFDIRARFRHPAKLLAPTDHLIVARAGGRVVALRVDRATDLIEVAAHKVEAVTAAVPDAAYVAGVAKLDDGIVLIHDLETFLNDAEAATLDGALAGVAADEGGA